VVVLAVNKLTRPPLLTAVSGNMVLEPIVECAIRLSPKITGEIELSGELAHV
jgi:hypothetical protein